MAHAEGSLGLTKNKIGARVAFKTNHVVYSPAEPATGNEPAFFLKSGVCLIGESTLKGVKSGLGCFMESGNSSV